MKISEIEDRLKDIPYSFFVKTIGNGVKFHKFVSYCCPACGATTQKRVSGFKTILCDPCARLQNAKKARTKIEDLQAEIEFLKKHGATFQELYFKLLPNKGYSTAYIKYRCSCGALVDTRLSLFRNDRKQPAFCKKCISSSRIGKGKPPKTPESVLKQRVERDRGVFLSFKENKVNFLCACGKAHSVFYRKSKPQTYTCDSCTSLRRKTSAPKNKLSLQQVRKFFYDAGCFPLFFSYQGHRQLLPFICTCGNTGQYRIASFYANKKSRPKCGVCLRKGNSRQYSPCFNPKLTTQDRVERFRRTRPKQTEIWRRQIFKRDDYTCQISGVRGGKLAAHHLYNWADNPEKRYEISNGVTIRRDLHDMFHVRYGKKNTTPEMFQEFKDSFDNG